MGIIESLCVVHGCATHYYSKEGRGHIAGMSAQDTSMNKHDVKLMISLQFDIHESERLFNLMRMFNFAGNIPFHILHIQWSLP